MHAHLPFTRTRTRISGGGPAMGGRASGTTSTGIPRDGERVLFIRRASLEALTTRLKETRAEYAQKRDAFRQEAINLTFAMLALATALFNIALFCYFFLGVWYVGYTVKSETRARPKSTSAHTHPHILGTEGPMAGRASGMTSMDISKDVQLTGLIARDDIQILVACCTKDVVKEDLERVITSLEVAQATFQIEKTKKEITPILEKVRKILDSTGSKRSIHQIWKQLAQTITYAETALRKAKYDLEQLKQSQPGLELRPPVFVAPSFDDLPDDYSEHWAEIKRESDEKVQILQTSAMLDWQPHIERAYTVHLESIEPLAQRLAKFITDIDLQKDLWRDLETMYAEAWYVSLAETPVFKSSETPPLLDVATRVRDALALAYRSKKAMKDAQYVLAQVQKHAEMLYSCNSFLEEVTIDVETILKNYKSDVTKLVQQAALAWKSTRKGIVDASKEKFDLFVAERKKLAAAAAEKEAAQRRADEEAARIAAEAEAAKRKELLETLELKQMEMGGLRTNFDKVWQKTWDAKGAATAHRLRRHLQESARVLQAAQTELQELKETHTKNIALEVPVVATPPFDDLPDNAILVWNGIKLKLEQGALKEKDKALLAWASDIERAYSAHNETINTLSKSLTDATEQCDSQEIWWEQIKSQCDDAWNESRRAPLLVVTLKTPNLTDMEEDIQKMQKYCDRLTELAKDMARKSEQAEKCVKMLDSWDSIEATIEPKVKKTLQTFKNELANLAVTARSAWAVVQKNIVEAGNKEADVFVAKQKELAAAAAEKEAAQRRAAEEAARIAAEEEAARKRAIEERAALKKARDEEAAKKKADDEEAARKKVEEEEAARKNKEETKAEKQKEAKEKAERKKVEEKKRKAEKKKAAEEEAARKRAAEEEAARKRAAEEEAERKKAAAAEAARKKAAAEEAARKRAAEEAARQKAEEEEAARKKAEEEEAARKRAAEEEAARKRAAEEIRRVAEAAVKEEVNRKLKAAIEGNALLRSSVYYTSINGEEVVNVTMQNTTPVACIALELYATVCANYPTRLSPEWHKFCEDAHSAAESLKDRHTDEIQGDKNAAFRAWTHAHGNTALEILRGGPNTEECLEAFEIIRRCVPGMALDASPRCETCMRTATGIITAVAELNTQITKAESVMAEIVRTMGGYFTSPSTDPANELIALQSLLNKNKLPDLSALDHSLPSRWAETEGWLRYIALDSYMVELKSTWNGKFSVEPDTMRRLVELKTFVLLMGSVAPGGFRVLLGEWEGMFRKKLDYVQYAHDTVIPGDSLTRVLLFRRSLDDDAQLHEDLRLTDRELVLLLPFNDIAVSLSLSSSRHYPERKYYDYTWINDDLVRTASLMWRLTRALRGGSSGQSAQPLGGSVNICHVVMATVEAEFENALGVLLETCTTNFDVTVEPRVVFFFAADVLACETIFNVAPGGLVDTKQGTPLFDGETTLKIIRYQTAAHEFAEKCARSTSHRPDGRFDALLGSPWVSGYIHSLPRLPEAVKFLSHVLFELRTHITVRIVQDIRAVLVYSVWKHEAENFTDQTPKEFKAPMIVPEGGFLKYYFSAPHDKVLKMIADVQDARDKVLEELISSVQDDNWEETAREALEAVYPQTSKYPELQVDVVLQRIRWIGKDRKVGIKGKEHAASASARAYTEHIPRYCEACDPFPSAGIITEHAHEGRMCYGWTDEGDSMRHTEADRVIWEWTHLREFLVRARDASAPAQNRAWKGVPF